MTAHVDLPPLMVFADDWGRHPSSCQHLVRRLRDDYRVLWVNSIGTRRVRSDGLTLHRGAEKLRNWMEGLKQVGAQMWVLDLPMLPGLGNRLVREVNRTLATLRLKRVLAGLGMSKPVILTTLPYIDWLIEGLPRRALVYYCTDDYSHWPDADRDTLQQADRDMTRRADLILGASQALVSSHQHSGRCRYFPHGVDATHFAQAQQAANTASAVACLPQPRIGYFGLVYEKLDFSLLTAVANAYPAGSLVMIGPIVTCPADFKAQANVHLLGPQPYAELPKFLAGLDVLLLPYVDDPMIRQSGPLKLRECLACGKPTVSIDVPEVRSFLPHVRIGKDQSEFLDCLRETLGEAADGTLAHARQRAVANDSWENRAAFLRSELAQFSRPAAPLVHHNGKPGRRRVLHLRVVAGKGGGPEKTILNSPRFLADAYDVRIAYIRPENDRAYDVPERAQRQGVSLLDIPERGPVDPRTLWTLAREIDHFRPHLLHAHDYKSDFLGVLLGRWFHVPVVTTLHGFSAQGGRFRAYYALDRWALRRMDHVIAVSPDLHRWLMDEMRIPEQRCSQIDNAIDLDQYARRRSRQQARMELGIAADHLVIGSIGRLAKEKGFDDLIRSVARLAERGVPVELIIAGEGDERARLQAIVEQTGFASSVRLLGHQSDTALLYEAMDVFALSSRSEAFPNVLLEAMAMEVPVIATRVGGVPRLVAHKKNGLLVEAGALDSLTDGLALLLNDESLRHRLGQEGRRTVAAEFSFAARMKKIRAIYDQIL